MPVSLCKTEDISEGKTSNNDFILSRVCPVSKEKQAQSGQQVLPETKVSKEKAVKKDHPDQKDVPDNRDHLDHLVPKEIL